MIKIDCVKIDTKYSVTTFTFYPKNMSEEDFAKYINSFEELKNVYGEKDMQYVKRNITINIAQPKDIQESLVEAIKDKNLTLFLMYATSKYASVRILCESILKHFDTTEMEII